MRRDDQRAVAATSPDVPRGSVPPERRNSTLEPFWVSWLSHRAGARRGPRTRVETRSPIGPKPRHVSRCRSLPRRPAWRQAPAFGSPRYRVEKSSPPVAQSRLQNSIVRVVQSQDIECLIHNGCGLCKGCQAPRGRRRQWHTRKRRKGCDATRGWRWQWHRRDPRHPDAHSKGLARAFHALRRARRNGCTIALGLDDRGGDLEPAGARITPITALGQSGHARKRTATGRSREECACHRRINMSFRTSSISPMWRNGDGRLLACPRCERRGQ
jgi:hypothetical protein